MVKRTYVKYVLRTYISRMYIITYVLARYTQIRANIRKYQVRDFFPLVLNRIPIGTQISIRYLPIPSF